LARVLQKQGENLERLILKLDSDPVFAEFSRIEVSLERAKANQRPNISTACHRRLRVPQSIASSKAWKKMPNIPAFSGLHRDQIATWWPPPIHRTSGLAQRHWDSPAAQAKPLLALEDR